MTRLGIIEGFYGRSWPDEERRSMFRFMAEQGLQEYIYAPKSDSKLRSAWQQPYSDSELDALLSLNLYANQLQLDFSLGFSPLGLVEQIDQQGFTATIKNQLRLKLQQLQQLQLKTLSVLFDDMPGSCQHLASLQLQVIDFISAHCSSAITVCPSYYSYDPVLETVFGPMPKLYLDELGRNLDAQIDIFWTGDYVCTQVFEPDCFVKITDVLRRRPVLWDNYPVNDGKKISKQLHLAEFGSRCLFPADAVAGHFANPMNQPNLSKISLLSLSSVYNRQSNAQSSNDHPHFVTKDFVSVCADEQLAAQLLDDAGSFQLAGLDHYSDAQKQALALSYQRFNHPVATEVSDWLSGKYAFDPACLTD